MIHIFYHSIDLDGHCSGAIAAYYFRSPKFFKLHPIDHGDRFPWEEINPDDEVYMLDFALPPQDMERLCVHSSVTWIDHHKRNIDLVKKAIVENTLYQGTQEDGIAACEQTWTWFFGREIPLAVTLLGSYDVWDHSDEDTLPFQYGMRMCITDPIKERSMKLWEQLFDIKNRHLISDICSEGRVCVRYQKQQDARYLELQGFSLHFHGHHCIACNIGKPYANSQMFGEDFEHYDMVIAFVYVEDKWVVSLYTQDDTIDVAEIAAKYGGGGHAKAAGFKCKDLPW